MLEDQVKDLLEILLSVLLLTQVDQFGFIRQLGKLKVRKLLLDDLVEGFQVPEASVLLVEVLALDADLDLILGMGQDAMVVARYIQLEIVDM